MEVRGPELSDMYGNSSQKQSSLPHKKPCTELPTEPDWQPPDWAQLKYGLSVNFGFDPTTQGRPTVGGTGPKTASTKTLVERTRVLDHRMVEWMFGMFHDARREGV